MEAEFTLKNVLDVLENNGFHVQSALEEKEKFRRESCNPLPKATIAIFLKIVPKKVRP